MCALIGLEVKRSYSSCSLLVIILETTRRRPRWKSRFYKCKEVKSNTSHTKRLAYRDIAEHSINVFLTTQRLTALPVNVKTRLNKDASSFWEPISTKTENRRSWKKYFMFFFTYSLLWLLLFSPQMIGTKLDSELCTEKVSIEQVPPNNSAEPTGPLIEKTSKSNLREHTPKNESVQN